MGWPSFIETAAALLNAPTSGVSPPGKKSPIHSQLSGQGLFLRDWLFHAARHLPQVFHITTG